MSRFENPGYNILGFVVFIRKILYNVGMLDSEKIIQDKSTEERRLEAEVTEQKEKELASEQKPEVQLEQPAEKTAERLEPEEAPEAKIATPKVGAAPQVRLNDLRKMSRQNQVKMLCKLAFEQGLEEAIKTAKTLDNAYVLDEFHDTLADQLYKRLVAENKLKKL